MNLLSRFKISSKLAGMLASALAVCANIALSTSLSQKRMLDDRVTQLRTAAPSSVGFERGKNAGRDPSRVERSGADRMTSARPGVRRKNHRADIRHPASDGTSQRHGLVSALVGDGI